MGSSLTEYKKITLGKNEKQKKKYASLKGSDYVLLPVWKFADAFKERRNRMGKLTGFMIKGKTSVLCTEPQRAVKWMYLPPNAYAIREFLWRECIKGNPLM